MVALYLHPLGNRANVSPYGDHTGPRSAQWSARLVGRRWKQPTNAHTRAASASRRATANGVLELWNRTLHHACWVLSHECHLARRELVLYLCRWLEPDLLTLSHRRRGYSKGQLPYRSRYRDFLELFRRICHRVGWPGVRHQAAPNQVS
jgi:hypothetical protein